jgi:hypothetical protein
MKHLIAFLTGAVLLGLIGCGGDATGPIWQVTGTWGGPHIQLVATADGAALEYDCAHGSIDGSLTADARGQFTLTGTYTRESGGPIRSSDTPDVHPARYQGKITGNELALTITLTDSGEMIGPYTLTRGESGRVYKCL